MTTTVPAPALPDECPHSIEHLLVGDSVVPERKGPCVAIFSTAEGLPLAEKMRQYLEPFATPIVWKDYPIFSHSYCKTLDLLMRTADAAAIILTPDDVLISREQTRISSRDNVIMELGMAFGCVRRECTFVVRPQDSDYALPSNLAGLVAAIYDTGSDWPMAASSACKTAAEKIAERARTGICKRADQVESWCWRLAAHLKRVASGGFAFEAIAAIPGGGGYAGDFLHSVFGYRQKLVFLDVDRTKRPPQLSFSDNQHVIAKLKSQNIRSILIVDDVARSGGTIAAAKCLLAEHLPNASVICAVLLADSKAEGIDFCAERGTTKNILFPRSQSEWSR